MGEYFFLDCKLDYNITLVVYPYEKPQVLIMKSNLKSFRIFGRTTKYLANTFISLVTLCTSVFALENVPRKNFVFRLNGESRGFDAEKAGISNGKNGGLNGGHVGPLPPDGMYHVSDINGGSNGNTNIDMIHGSLTDKVNNKLLKYPPSTCV